MKAPTKIPPVPPPKRQAMSEREHYYYSVLVRWYEYRKRSPSIPELQKLTKPTVSMTAIRSSLLSLESKGYVERNNRGQFEVIR